MDTNINKWDNVDFYINGKKIEGIKGVEYKQKKLHRSLN